MNPDDITLVDTNNLGILIVDAMHIAESDRSMIGQDKKAFVLQTVKTILGPESYDRYAPLLEILIDLLVSISRKDVELMLNRTKKCLLSFGTCK